MRYTIHALVNYPEQKDVETPTVIVGSSATLLAWVVKLLADEPDATSFVVTIVRKPLTVEH